MPDRIEVFETTNRLDDTARYNFRPASAHYHYEVANLNRRSILLAEPHDTLANNRFALTRLPHRYEMKAMARQSGLRGRLRRVRLPHHRQLPPPHPIRAKNANATALQSPFPSRCKFCKNGGMVTLQLCVVNYFLHPSSEPRLHGVSRFSMRKCGRTELRSSFRSTPPPRRDSSRSARRTKFDPTSSAGICHPNWSLRFQSRRRRQRAQRSSAKVPRSDLAGDAVSVDSPQPFKASRRHHRAKRPSPLRRQRGVVEGETRDRLRFKNPDQRRRRRQG